MHNPPQHKKLTESEFMDSENFAQQMFGFKFPVAGALFNNPLTNAIGNLVRRNSSVDYANDAAFNIKNDVELPEATPMSVNARGARAPGRTESRKSRRQAGAS